MPEHSQIANIYARGEIRNSADASIFGVSQYANMEDDDDLESGLNEGPNHLRAWMKFRGIKGAALAKALNVSPAMVSDLINSNRALTAKWLRRIAPVLDTTPGMLLDHDPNELDNDIVDIWVSANSEERRRLKDVAQALVKRGGKKDGTNG